MSTGRGCGPCGGLRRTPVATGVRTAAGHAPCLRPHLPVRAATRDAPRHRPWNWASTNAPATHGPDRVHRLSDGPRGQSGESSVNGHGAGGPTAEERSPTRRMWRRPATVRDSEAPAPRLGSRPAEGAQEMVHWKDAARVVSPHGAGRRSGACGCRCATSHGQLEVAVLAESAAGAAMRTDLPRQGRDRI